MLPTTPHHPAAPWPPPAFIPETAGAHQATIDKGHGNLVLTAVKTMMIYWPMIIDSVRREATANDLLPKKADEAEHQWFPTPSERSANTAMIWAEAPTLPPLP